MIETILIFVVVFILAAVSVYALRKRRDLQEMKEALADTNVNRVKLLEIMSTDEDKFVNLPSLFRDDDYIWLKNEVELKNQARILKNRRIRLARQYLRLIRNEFDRLICLHNFISTLGMTGGEDRDRAASLALMFKYRILLAYWLLPLNYVRLNLSALEEFVAAFQSLSASVRDRLPLHLS